MSSLQMNFSYFLAIHVAFAKCVDFLKGFQWLSLWSVLDYSLFSCFLHVLLCSAHSCYIDFLTHEHHQLRTSEQLCFLNKCYKTPHGIRPIVRGCNGPTEKLSDLMDHFLKPLVLQPCQRFPRHYASVGNSKSLAKLHTTHYRC